MKHNLIRDEKTLQDFIDWLPDLELNQKYFLAMFARKKYMNEIKSSDKTQLKRFVSNKEDIIWKLKQLECEVGVYTTKTGLIIPDEGLVLYIMPNPRDIRKSAFQLITKMLQHIENDNEFMNPHAEALSCMQRCKAKSRFVHFDIDNGSPNEVYDVVTNFISRGFHILETRGGCHLLIRPDQVDHSGNWHGEIRKGLEPFKVDQTGDLMMPIPGCIQGGFVPNFFEQK